MAQTHSRKANESDSVVEAVQDGAQTVMDAGTKIYNAAIDQTRQVSRQATGYVRDNPLRTLAVAAGAGFVLGFLYGRRS